MSRIPAGSAPTPLAGITVIDMGQVLASPFATYLMALLGADVIKIEPHGGEWFRKMGTGLAFATQNADKRMVSIDMRQPDAAETVLRLIESADVFVQGFAPGTADAMGLGWEAVSARNSTIVYGALSAFGDAGPYAGRPGFDHVVQAVSGIMPATGFEGQPPTKVGSPYLDFGSGLLLAFGVLAGLLERQRTNAAVHIDATMLDVGLMLNASAMVRAANTGLDPVRTGNDAFSGAVASGCFETTDGLLMVAANKPSHFLAVADILGLDWLRGSPELALPRADADKVAAAKSAMRERFATRPGAEWETALNAAGVPAARVRSLSEVTSEGHPQARGILQHVADPVDLEPDRTTQLPGLGVKINGVMPGPTSVPGAAGSDTREVLVQRGFNDAEIDALMASGTIFGAS